MTLEDRRAAIGMSVTLSGQLMAASLAMLAIGGSWVAYAIGNREPYRGFAAVAVLSALAFVLSLLLGGRAVTAARNAGFYGGWSLDAGRRGFDWQARLCLLGLLLFGLVLALSGQSGSSLLEADVSELRGASAQVSERVAAIEEALEVERRRVSSLSYRLADLENLLEGLRRTDGNENVGAR